MSVKSRRLKLDSVKPSLSLLIGSTLVGSTVLLLVLPHLVDWVMQKLPVPTQPTSPKFEAAYRAVLEFGKTSGYASALSGSYSISQLDYDTWRQLNGKPIKDLAEIQPEEVKAIYQTRWQAGKCEQYASPLDFACLDSVLSFGVQQSSELFSHLPSDSKQAAMEIASRREKLRRENLQPPITPGKQMALREGLKRDHALAAWIAADMLPPLKSSPQTESLQPNVNTAPAEESAVSGDQIYTKIKPTTVEVWNTPRLGMATAAAGVILTPDGLVLTNYHVVESNSSPSVKLSDGRKFAGLVTSIDPNLDLALIQLRGANNLPTTLFSSDTSQVKVGDSVYAIGSPSGESRKISTSQVIELNSACANGASPMRCIRTASGFLHPGDSGGPLINSSGQVIGINRAVQQFTGEGISIPIETIKVFLDRRMGQPQQMNQSQFSPSCASICINSAV